MIDLIHEIGPILGIVAFLGFAVLAFLIFQQAREVRRLREWAGRAPERAEEAAEASVAAAEARGEADAEGAPETGRIAARLRPLWERLDRSSPLDLRYLALLLAALALAAGALVGGFGLAGEDEPKRNRGGERGEARQQQRERSREVAVLNATQVIGPDGIMIQGVPGLADEIAEEVVRPAAGFRPGRRDNAASGYESTTIMFEPDSRRAADRLADVVSPALGETPVEPMIQEVRDLAGGAPLAIVVGQDDATL